MVIILVVEYINQVQYIKNAGIIITNEGVISGTGTSCGDDGNGYGIYNGGTMGAIIMGDITNTGVISGAGSSLVVMVMVRVMEYII